MDPDRCEEQTPVQSRCGKVVNGSSSQNFHVSEAILGDKMEEIRDLGDFFVSPTPEKPDLGGRSREAVSLARKQLAEDFDDEELSGPVVDVRRFRTNDDLVELPEKYKILADLFNRMETSIRLLGLRKISPTFQSISKQVEILTKRKLLYSHIAQMKYVFSEAINTEKILVHDKETLLMIPEMKITLNMSVVEHIPGSFRSASMALCDAFHARILDFFMMHPEITDIPGTMLPDPFDKIHDNNEILTIQLPPEERTSELPQITVEPDLLSTASHLPLSFGKRFSKGLVAQEEQNSALLLNNTHLDSSSTGDHNMELWSSQKLEVSSSSADTPGKASSMLKHSVILQMSDNTPSRVASSLGVVAADTPVMQTPKRPLPTPQERLVSDNKELDVESKTTTSARRSLMYTPTGGSNQVDDSSCSTETSGCSLDKNVCVRRCLLTEEVENFLPDAVDNIIVDQHEKPNLSHNRNMPNNEMPLCLATFDAICLISRSTNCSEITKEELVHKILSNNLEIDETSEVEEQLNELELMVPEWISKKADPNGKYIYCIKQTSNPEAVRARLVDAV